MHQGLVFSPVLCNIVMKKLEREGVRCKVQRFAHSTKLSGAVVAREVCAGLFGGASECPRGMGSGMDILICYLYVESIACWKFLFLLQGS